MKDCYATSREMNVPTKREELISTTIRKHVDAYASHLNYKDCFKKIIENGYAVALLQTYNTIYGKDLKRKTLWLCGGASTGKSTYLKA